MTQQSENISTGLPVVLGLIAVTVGSMSFVVTTVPRQTTVLSACYVPNVGVIYRIKAEGLPDACTETTHVEFSWNMEGPVGPAGAAGPAGPTGPQGETGSQGAVGVSGWEIVTQSFAGSVTGGLTFNEGSATCPTGKKALGGGTEATETVVDAAKDLFLLNTGPNAAGTAWEAKWHNDSSNAHPFSVTVICANVD